MSIVNLSYNSGTLTDILVFVKEDSFTVGDTGVFTIDIPHGLPFTPLPEMVWSHTADFAICQSGVDEDYFDNQWTTLVGEYYDIVADPTNLVIHGNNNSGSTKTVYYRIWCFPPSNADVNSIVPATATHADKFAFNSDYNYMKLAFSGYLGTVNPGTASFTHNLGYIPRVKAWEVTGDYDFVAPTMLTQLISTDIDGSGGLSSGLYSTTTQLLLMNDFEVNGIEYRIYYDS
jgi:hypothetical protein